MNKNTMIYIGGFAIIAVLVIVTLAYGASQDAGFGGADDAGGDVVGEGRPSRWKPCWMRWRIISRDMNRCAK